MRRFAKTKANVFVCLLLAHVLDTLQVLGVKKNKNYMRLNQIRVKIGVFISILEVFNP